MKKKSLQESLDMSQTIDVFFKIIYDGVGYNSEANIPFLSAQFLQRTYNTVRSSGIYKYACKDSHRNPSREKTWASFKIFLALEYNDIREEQNINSTQARFHHANHDVE